MPFPAAIFPHRRRTGQGRSDPLKLRLAAVAARRLLTPMDINVLVVSIGNSRLAVGSFIAGELTRSTRVPLADRGEWAGVIRGAWDTIGGRTAAVVGLSVNPPAVE